ncbi:DUF1810 domain-containing protein [Mucilaginibacter hurinus]|uniref:DUF1810 domain-containing protein n=1 Tax=Mucilaginibacter hurinus TaxID=2201324 RepID=A0A367GMP8_9SPHI|nr:DUF1810 domain-containing protein [Mucilaginibacter hurinus]RCH53961.1 DUF1810 domain-containing protein [Mucilaginibacter hurinus]
MNNYNSTLQRFIDAQQHDYETALAEIKAGRKRSHWMWYIFPQMAGLGMSDTSRFYAIENIDEAGAYLAHETLGPRLIELCRALLQLQTDNPHHVFGSPDDQKLQSSMTLFEAVPASSPVFGQVLAKFYGGLRDQRTLSLIRQA